MIEARTLTKRYGNRTVVDSVSFAIGNGEVFGLLGPNGAGKSTCIKMLTGLSVPDGGQAFVGGLDLKQFPFEARTKFRVVSQENTLDRDLSLLENLQVHAMLYRIPQAQERIEEVLTRLELQEFRNQMPGKLSGGQQRRLILSRAMMGRAEALFLDEPSLGLDPQIRHQMWETIRQARHSGTAILLTTHYIEEADALCDRVGIINSGRLIRIDTPSRLKAELGAWSCVVVDKDGHEMITHHTDREAATRQCAASQQNATIRRTTLEDVFLHLTGKGLQ